jgi:hypothetical protein
MPTSKTRGSRKEHRKRVIHRNNTIKGERRKMEQRYQEMMKEAYEKFLVENEGKFSGETENVETSENVNINLEDKERGITIINVGEENAANIEVDYIPVSQNIIDNEK